MYIVRINNDKMFDKYFPTYEDALSDYDACKILFSDAQLIEADVTQDDK